MEIIEQLLMDFRLEEPDASVVIVGDELTGIFQVLIEVERQLRFLVFRQDGKVAVLVAENGRITLIGLVLFVAT
jgi:hypothetical protein